MTLKCKRDERAAADRPGERGRVCEAHENGLPSMSGFVSSAVEATTLDLIRHVGLVYATGEGAHWDACLARSASRHGSLHGAALAARATALMRAVRSERRGRFNFMMPGCCHVTADEVALLGVIAKGRCAEDWRLRTAAATFAGTSACPQLAAAARALSDLQKIIESIGSKSIADTSGEPVRLPVLH
jgi:hypothetical protein